MARLGFNANEVAPSEGGGPLPPGEYEMHVIEESLEQNSKGTGEILKLTYEVLGPSQAGRRMWVILNVVNANPVAQKIGQEELSALCHATGQMEVEDTEELLWKPFRAVTKIQVDKNDGRERAAVKKYLYGDALDAPAAKAPPQRPAPTARAAAPAARPAAAASRPASAARPAAGAGRSLPWQGNRGAAPAAAQLDDDIPF